jgi:hypothetical protein
MEQVQEEIINQNGEEAEQGEADARGNEKDTEGSEKVLEGSEKDTEGSEEDTEGSEEDTEGLVDPETIAAYVPERGNRSQDAYEEGLRKCGYEISECSRNMFDDCSYEDHLLTLFEAPGWITTSILLQPISAADARIAIVFREGTQPSLKWFQTSLRPFWVAKRIHLSPHIATSVLLD